MPENLISPQTHRDTEKRHLQFSCSLRLCVSVVTSLSPGTPCGPLNASNLHSAQIRSLACRSLVALHLRKLLPGRHTGSRNASHPRPNPGIQLGILREDVKI